MYDRLRNIRRPMNHSIFIQSNGERYEYHNLSYTEAMALAMKHLYKDDTPVAGVNIKIRTENGIVFTANNP